MDNNSRSLVDAKTILLPVLLAALLVFSSQFSFLLFHTLAEFFAIVVAILAAVVAWQMYAFTRNHFLMYLGCGYFWIAVLDMAHALTYKGMSIVPVTDTDVAIQFWIGTRYLEALLLLTAPWFLAHSLKRNVAISIFGGISIVLFMSVMSGNFPAGFIEGQGLTEFKIYSEYIIIGILAAAIIYLVLQRKLIDRRVFVLMVVSIAFTMMAEMAFTFYVSVYGLSNLAGHILKLFSFWLIFVAVVRTTLREPFSAISKAETYYDAVPDATIIVDKKGIIQHANKLACSLVNQSCTKLPGKSAHSIFHNKNTSYDNCTVCQTIASGTELSAYEMQISDTSWFDFSTSLIQGEDNYVEVMRDITAKKRVAIALEKSEAWLDITLNSIGDAVITTDTQGNVTHMNPVAEKLTGWSFEEAKDRVLKDIFPILDASTRKPIENPVDKVISTGEITYFSNYITLIAKDGTEYKIADSAAPIRDGKDNIQGMVLVFNDVTEQYKLRESVDKNKRDLQSIMDNSPAVIYVKDTDSRFIFINQQFEKLFHIQREDIIGKTLYDIFPKDVADEMRHNDKAVVEAGHALESEEVAPHDDGPHTYVSIKFPLFNDKDNIYAICGISTDITERKNIENTLQESQYNLIKAQEIAKVGNWKLNPETREVEGSKELLNIFELDINDMTLDNFLDVVHPEDREYDLKYIQEGIEQGVPWDIEHRLLLKDGSIKWVHVVGEPIFDDDGRVTSLVGVVQDITERKQQNERLHRTQKMDALGKLTGGVAHDYNNMLGVIMGYSELLEGALSEQPKLAKYAHEILYAGERGAKLTKKLLAFSRKKSTDAETLNLNALLQDEQHMLEKILTTRIKLLLDLTEDLWPVWLNSGDLEDVIVNLSINAMHAIEGNGRLTLRTSNEQLNAMDAKPLDLEPGDYVLLGITDTGCGMDEAVKERIFEPFYSTKGEKGTGLGLSQVYGFVERSNGAIKVYSEPGHGTRFVLYFPRYYESGRDEQPTEDQPVIDSKGNETILVVDDEPALLDLTREILGQQGYNVICAQSCEQALDILATESIDLLLSDVIMPDMDGYQLVKAVQEKYPAVKIQLASGFSDNRHKELVDDVLHQNLLDKPFNSKTLLQKIRTLLDD